jgi:hypothetical protein
MRAMITAYREDNDGVEFKFVHVFARIETCDKWKEVRTTLAKAAAPFDPNDTPTPAAVGRPVGNKKAKAMRDPAPAIEKLHSSILACIATAAAHAATRAEQAAKMEEVAPAKWASVMERQDIKLDLIKANIVAKKRKEDLAILLVDTSGMDDDVKAWCAAQRATMLAES